MASPQLEHGHVRLANRLIEAILEAEFQGAQLRILFGLVRLTYGWRRHTARISVPDLATYVKAKPTGGFRRALAELVQEGVLLQLEHGVGAVVSVYAIQKDFTRWGRFSVAEQRLERVWGERPASDDRLYKNRPADAESARSMPGNEPEIEAENGHDGTPQQGNTIYKGSDPKGSQDDTPQGNTNSPQGVTGTGSNAPPDQHLEARKDIEIQERHDTDTARARDPETAPPKTAPGNDPPSPAKPDVAKYAIGLTTAANRGITERWGEQPSPLHHGGSYQLAQDVHGAGIDLELARTAIVAACKASKNEKPPKSINYFREVVFQANRDAEQRTLDASSTKPRDPKSKGPTPLSTVVRRVVDPEAERRLEREVAAYSEAKRQAGVDWGNDPNNKTKYDQIVAQANANFRDKMGTRIGDMMRLEFIVDECSKASGFPRDMTVWSASRVPQPTSQGQSP